MINNNERHLNMCYAIEAPNGRINGSSSKVENSKSGFDNITFTKKIKGKGYVASVCEKKGIKNYMEYDGCKLSNKTKIGKKVIIDADPINNIDEDAFGFMLASNGILNEDTYNELTEEDKKKYKKIKEGYKLDIQLTKEQYDELSEVEKRMWKNSKGKYIPIEKSTTKRRACLEMNGLIGVGTSKVKEEWGVCETNGDNMPYVLETYSDIMAGLANFNITRIGNFTMGDKSVQFKDYDVADGIEEKNLSLSREEKLKRIETILKGIQYLSIKTNQSNYLVDTTPKIVIMAEYDFGNNVFQGLINKNGINIEGLIETIDEFDEFRISDMWIGVSNRIENENFQGLKEKLQEVLKDYDFIHIDSVQNAFDGYLDFVKETL